jgi:hypothetical protein
MPRTCGTKIGQVRVCGGSGWVTTRFYPARFHTPSVKLSQKW